MEKWEKKRGESLLHAVAKSTETTETNEQKYQTCRLPEQSARWVTWWADNDKYVWPMRERGRDAWRHGDTTQPPTVRQRTKTIAGTGGGARWDERRRRHRGQPGVQTSCSAERTHTLCNESSLKAVLLVDASHVTLHCHTSLRRLCWYLVAACAADTQQPLDLRLGRTTLFVMFESTTTVVSYT